MSLTAFKYTEIPIPQEIVNSGDYVSAENILANEKVPGEILAERFYRLGNNFYSAAQNQAAEMAWQMPRNFSGRTRIDRGTVATALLTIRDRLVWFWGCASEVG